MINNLYIIINSKFLAQFYQNLTFSIFSISFLIEESDQFEVLCCYGTIYYKHYDQGYDNLKDLWEDKDNLVDFYHSVMNILCTSVLR